ncbi:phospholipase D-like domain-containing protein [Pseudooceanicola sp. MF1-13]|uniref:phospholipase D-like domain-containing protein n=1 Tax=Pseudooceanicola sp. MF1-13 TaxID=3379095 RepID=UPI003892275A
MTLTQTAEDLGPATPELTPLITASEMFPELERLVLNAREEVLLAFRIFDARTALHSPEALNKGLKTWADLFAHTAERGVQIRLLLADFDPVFTPDLHREAWASAGRFESRTVNHPNAEIVCALHNCAPAPLWTYLFAPAIAKRRARLRKMPHEHLTPLQLQALDGPFTLRPVTLHQKFAIADQTRAIIGGIDVDERRWDDHDHNQRPEDTWHDVSMAVTGKIVGDLRDHFATCWKRSIDDCGTVFSHEATELPPAKTAPNDEREDDDGVDLLRTVSTHISHPIRFGPVTETKEHESAYIDAVNSAEHSIYIETQFLRHLPLARAMAQRGRDVPDLNLILVLPTEPERVIFGANTGMDARHAQALQLKCLTMLRRAYGDRLAIVSPAQAWAAPEGTRMPVAGSGIIYLHSKVMLIDNALGIVGSANLNGRSLLWDTEASVRFRDAETIDTLRTRLASKWLRTADHGPIDLAPSWMDAARAAEQVSPEDREAMILPYPERRNRRFARYIPILPAAMF